MKLHIENSIVIENNGRTTTLGKGEYEFDSVNEFIRFVERLGEPTKQPLIRDEKIRKVIRAWAEVNGVSELFSYEAVSGCPFWYIMAYRDVGGLNLDLWGEFPKELTNDKSYTIAELCGEEEE